VHESSLARRLVELAVARAAEHGARAIRRVDAWVAETETLSAESLRLHFARFAHGTTAEAAALELRVAHVEARCDGCGSRYAPEHHVLVCPTCGHVGGQLLGRTGVGIEALEVEGA
jgi:hydrogenase nickel incorporation protein HypA/HybF